MKAVCVEAKVNSQRCSVARTWSGNGGMPVWDSEDLFHSGSDSQHPTLWYWSACLRESGSVRRVWSEYHKLPFQEPGFAVVVSDYLAF